MHIRVYESQTRVHVHSDVESSTRILHHVIPYNVGCPEEPINGEYLFLRKIPIRQGSLPSKWKDRDATGNRQQEKYSNHSCKYFPLSFGTQIIEIESRSERFSYRSPEFNEKKAVDDDKYWNFYEKKYTNTALGLAVEERVVVGLSVPLNPKKRGVEPEVPTLSHSRSPHIEELGLLRILCCSFAIYRRICSSW